LTENVVQVPVEEITPGLIQPPRDHFPLGAWVEYHHRCSEIRLSKDDGSRSFPSGWNMCGAGRVRGRFPFEESLGKLPTNTGRNKSLLVWPEEGQGCVVGLVRRGIGRSVSGYTTRSDYGEEYESGWFVAEEWHWLYAVKTTMRGLDVIFVPMWAARWTLIPEEDGFQPLPNKY
jgi:hypothetical protein